MKKGKIYLGKRIRFLRDRLHLTQDQLSERVGISPKYLSSIERGKENPTLDTLFRLVDSLKVDPWEMFLIGQEEPDIKIVRKKIEKYLAHAEDDKLRLIMKFLQSVLN